MRRAHHIEAIESGLPQVVATIGSFDGVHLGHRGLIAQLRERATAAGTVAVVTFKPHPLRVLAPQRAPLMLTAWVDKYERLAAAGVDLCVELPFDKAFMSWSAERFVRELLVDKMGVSHVVSGPDLRFGKGRRGDVELLRRMGAELQFTVSHMTPVTHDGAQISSTSIRQLLADGDLAAANTLLAATHRVRGVVVAGEQVGRTIGFPTANLNCGDAAVPANGVYACYACLADGRRFRSAVSIGVRPTFGENARTVEAYLMDFSEDLYGQEVALDFVARLRGEVRYDSVEALVAQIERDVQNAREVLPL